MLKTLLICSTLVAFPALAQMNNSGAMNHSGMAGMSGTNGAMQGMNPSGMAGMSGTNGAMQGMNPSGMAGMSGTNADAMQGMDHSGMSGMSGANGNAMQGMNHGKMGGMDMSGMMKGAEGGHMMGSMMEKMQTMMGKMMMQQMMGKMMMERMQGMDHGGMSGMSSTNAASQGVGGSPLSEPGQSAFAAIAEVVKVLQADPNTDWSKVNIDALRNHLRDMDIVTIDSSTVTTEIDGGLRFDVTGAGEVSNAIRRMATAHAGMMNGTDGWAYSTEEIAGGAAMTVIVPEADLARLKGLGFYGIMAAGMHHQPHHWAMATGGSPHG